MSWPARPASGPSWPKPVMRPYTSRGLRASASPGPRPSRSMTPGRKPSSSMSALSSRRSARSRPSGRFRSSLMMVRPWRSRSNSGGSDRNGRPAPVRSMRSTSAPISASISAASGTGPRPAISTTCRPASGPGFPAADTAAISAPSVWRRRGGSSRRSASGCRRRAGQGPHIPPVRRAAEGRARRRPANPAPPAACPPSSAS